MVQSNTGSGYAGETDNLDKVAPTISVMGFYIA